MKFKIKISETIEPKRLEEIQKRYPSAKPGSILELDLFLDVKAIDFNVGYSSILLFNYGDPDFSYVTDTQKPTWNLSETLAHLKALVG